MKMWMKLTLANGVTIVGSLLFFGFFLNYTAISTLEKELDRRAEMGAQLVARQVDALIHNMEYCGNSMVVITNSTVTALNQSGKMDVSGKIKLENQISFTLSVFPEIASAWIILNNHSLAGYGRTQVGKEDIIEAALMDTDPWKPMGPNKLNVNPDKQIGDSVIILTKRLINIQTGQSLGTILLTVDKKSFRNILARTDTEIPAAYTIVNENSDLIVKLQDVRKNEPETIQNFSKFEASVTPVNWKVVSHISQEEIIQLTRRNTRIYSFVLILAAITAFLLGLAISRTITRPLESLIRQIQEMDIENGVGNLIVSGSSEVSRVAENTEKLLERVHTLVGKAAADERVKQQYRFELLQAQIKPHFLYNTLEMIHIMGDTGRIYKSQRAIRALSEFYRMSLSGGKELVSLHTEIELTRHYLFIQFMRYHDQFTYDFILPEESDLKTVSLPKLTLQPLVENAIYHGIKGMGERGRIVIIVEKKGNQWRVVISDNGLGMSSEVLENLQKPHQSGSSVGLHNVRQRLKLHRKKEMGLQIISEENRGTVIIIQTEDNNNLKPRSDYYPA